MNLFDDSDADAVARRRTYYEECGFIALPDQPLRLFMPIAAARAVLDQLWVKSLKVCI